MIKRSVLEFERGHGPLKAIVDDLEYAVVK
jgi:hypothetical protein